MPLEDDDTQSLVAKLVGVVAAVAATWIAQQVIAQAWKATMGHKPPKAEAKGDVRFREVASAAAITGAVVALTRVVATRGMARVLR